MKRILLLVAISCGVSNSFAQKNNPYDYRGVQYIQSMNMIVSDYERLLVSGFDEKSLETYSKRIPLQNQVSVELVAEVVDKVKDPKFDFEGYVNQNDYSAFTKEATLEIYSKIKELDASSLQTYLVEKTDAVNKQALDAQEREFLLTNIALTYHIALNNEQTSWGQKNPCREDGEFGMQVCTAAGALIGFVIGNAFGPLGGLAGSLIGALVVNIT